MSGSSAWPGPSSPYREQAEAKADEPPCGKEERTFTGGGYIVRQIKCPTPGAWSRLVHGICHGDIWECERCGAKWSWSKHDIRWCRSSQ